ncbi:hypothetical protein KUCAC02_037696, partial [Chaenocephalus aceratus]
SLRVSQSLSESFTSHRIVVLPQPFTKSRGRCEARRDGALFRFFLWSSKPAVGSERRGGERFDGESED